MAYHVCGRPHGAYTGKLRVDRRKLHPNAFTILRNQRPLIVELLQNLPYELLFLRCHGF